MPDPRQQFLELVSSLKPALVLEVGTLQSVPGRSTHLMSWFPHVKKPQYTMVDIAAGADVCGREHPRIAKGVDELF
jgi:hypothetical protein